MLYGGPICFTMQNFIEIGPAIAKIFLRWRPSAILDLQNAYLDRPRRALSGFYRCAKFGWNRWSSFDDMQVFVFCTFGLKMPIQAPKIGVLGEFDPLYQRNPQKAHPCLEWRHMTHRSSQSVHCCDLHARLRNQKKERKKDKETRQWQTGCSPRPPTSTDRNFVLHGLWSSGCGYIFQVSSKSVKGFARYGASKFAPSHWLGHWLIQH